jgi:hypothetical protein
MFRFVLESFRSPAMQKSLCRATTEEAVMRILYKKEDKKKRVRGPALRLIQIRCGVARLSALARQRPLVMIATGSRSVFQNLHNCAPKLRCGARAGTCAGRHDALWGDLCIGYTSNTSFV